MIKFERQLVLLLSWLLLSLASSQLVYKYESLSSTHLYQVEHLQVTNETYTGYISENVALPNSLNSQSTYSSHPVISLKSIYVRFVDQVKPAIEFELIPLSTSNSSLDEEICLKFDLSQLNLTLVDKTSDVLSSSLSSRSDLFEIDFSYSSSGYMCFSHQANARRCLCYLKIKLLDKQSVRDRINREAIDIYQLQLNIATEKSSNIVVKVLDDNDLEPMFVNNDPDGTVINLDEFIVSSNASLRRNILGEFSVVGRVQVTDPDLEQNGQPRYYIDRDSGNLLSYLLK